MQALEAVAKDLVSSKGVNNIITLAFSSCRDLEFAQKLNHNKDILGVKNGCVDLKTGALRPRVKEEYICIISPYEYNPQHPQHPDLLA